MNIDGNLQRPPRTKQSGRNSCFGVNIPSSGLSSIEEGASPVFYSEKNVRTVCFMIIQQLS